jgi:hypothetical protein
MVRAKFKVECITKYAHGTQVQLSPVTCGSEENEKFYQYTPGGGMSLMMIKDDVAELFIPGKEFYIDISAADVVSEGATNEV